ncbi:MAG: Methylase involved in ubiquinone/menaquinone biosynthesis [Betaproteobacteria bacterium]|nr:Methylase involved in ubiquinone/menaquinone biosynthesis [Betaproteobacteria bacterium]
MGDYTNMSAYYDVIMTSGYYDYEKIVQSILSDGEFTNVLEIGCGTGLILEELAKQRPKASITGMDLTEAMLDIARKRLQSFPNVSLTQQNIMQFKLEQQYQLAFSYGGVWYFVIDGDKEPVMISHLPDDADNHQGFAQLGKHVSAGGTLLLGVQGPHFDYERVISNGMKYSQKILAGEDGFTKHYYLADEAKTVMAQTIKYRTYSFADARKLMTTYGFEYNPDADFDKRFLGFTKQ